MLFVGDSGPLEKDLLFCCWKWETVPGMGFGMPCVGCFRMLYVRTTYGLLPIVPSAVCSRSTAQRLLAWLSHVRLHLFVPRISKTNVQDMLAGKYTVLWRHASAVSGMLRVFNVLSRLCGDVFFASKAPIGSRRQ